MGKTVLSLILRNQKKIDIEASVEVARAIAERHGEKGAVFFGGQNDFMSVDMKDVIIVYGGDGAGPTAIRSMAEQKNVTPAAIVKKVDVPREAPTETVAKELFKIECRCGADYFAALFSDTKRCRCRECQDTVFVDSFAPQLTGDNGRPATLVTNKYRVPFSDVQKEESA